MATIARDPLDLRQRMLRDAMAGVTLVHDYLLVMRGAERTFEAMAEIWPDAPIATLLYDPEGTEGAFEGRSITTSGLQRVVLDQGNFRRALPLFQTASGGLDIGETGMRGLEQQRLRPRGGGPAGATHICYCHTPFRYAWHERAAPLAEVPSRLRPALNLLLRRHRNSTGVRLLGWTVYRQRARHAGADQTPMGPRGSGASPPGGCGAVRSGGARGLRSLRRRARASQAARGRYRGGRGCGPSGSSWWAPDPSSSGSSTDTGERRCSSEESIENTLAGLYARASALVVPGIEEFGIAAVEAQAAGRPVVAVDAGGAQRDGGGQAGPGCWSPTEGSAALARALRED